MTGRERQDPRKPGPEEERARPSEDAGTAPREAARRPRTYPDPVDDALDDTFPASDPPSWAGR